jgi:hypothetical protein
MSHDGKHKSLDQWGKAAAKERSGLVSEPVISEVSPVMQAPQAPDDRHGANYDNDAKGWVRGNAMHPNFDTKASKGKDTP